MNQFSTCVWCSESAMASGLVLTSIQSVVIRATLGVSRYSGGRRSLTTSTASQHMRLRATKEMKGKSRRSVDLKGCIVEEGEAEAGRAGGELAGRTRWGRAILLRQDAQAWDEEEDASVMSREKNKKEDAGRRDLLSFDSEKKACSSWLHGRRRLICMDTLAMRSFLVMDCWSTRPLLLPLRRRHRRGPSCITWKEMLMLVRMAKEEPSLKVRC
ncbi:hypothetical protein B296_00011421 [Ensete ventricosum]|uniref:Uncharacterized protein n=1 Tax=Ensete ventricosum TaxID=4639 RepID=A0A426ZNT8_ENSVE|nr:hypothetical protein B296_00011421 [Ensete ventricosum]